ncbi:Uncharacterised protein [Mycobacteroides abscessus subsp. abscessus]|nr:Uncharacterised protein [Mycobacteroides abscessus subsp. abscessus]
MQVGLDLVLALGLGLRVGFPLGLDIRELTGLGVDRAPVLMDEFLKLMLQLVVILVVVVLFALDIVLGVV